MLLLQRLSAHSSVVGAAGCHAKPCAPAAAHLPVAKRSVRVQAGRIPKGVELIPDLSGMGQQPGLVGPSGESISGQPSQNDVNWDPENCFKGIPLRTGIIERRMMQKQLETDKDFAKAMKGAQDDIEREAIFRRETRKAPEDQEGLVEYFLDTPTEDLEYAVVKYRPRLDAGFFKRLDDLIGSERFAPDVDQERVNELDMLRKYLTEATEAVDKFIAKMQQAAQNLRKLLTSKDKKEEILDMASKNEIDQPLMHLLQQNIDAAKEAEQEQAVAFLEKIFNAASKYAIKPVSQQAPPPPPTQKAAPGSNIEIPNVSKIPSASNLGMPTQ